MQWLFRQKEEVSQADITGCYTTWQVCWKKQKKHAYMQKNRNILNGIVLNSQKIWVANRENLHYNKEN